MSEKPNGRANLLITLLTISVGVLSGVGGFAAYLVVGEVGRHSEILDSGILPLAAERTRSLEQRIQRLEQRLSDHEMDFRQHEREDH